MTDRTGNLRDRLRRDTRDSHAALDRRMAGLDLRAPDDLACFLRVMHSGFAALAARDAAPETGTILRDLSGRAAEDLSRLGRSFLLPGCESRSTASTYDRTAIDYVVLGSRLGTRQLRKIWRSSDDERVLHAKAYFSAPDHLEEWRAFCLRAGCKSADSLAADRTVEDARIIFDMFLKLANDSAGSEDIYNEYA